MLDDAEHIYEDPDKVANEDIYDCISPCPLPPRLPPLPLCPPRLPPSPPEVDLYIDVDSTALSDDQLNDKPPDEELYEYTADWKPVADLGHQPIQPPQALLQLPLPPSPPAAEVYEALPRVAQQLDDKPPDKKMRPITQSFSPDQLDLLVKILQQVTSQPAPQSPAHSEEEASPVAPESSVERKLRKWVWLYTPEMH